MTAWFTRPWGPSRPRGGGGQKVIKTVKAPPPSGGGSKKTGCFLVAVPALALAAACTSLLATGAIR